MLGDRLDIPSGIGRSGRCGPRFHSRPKALDPEQALESVAPQPGAERSLSSYIPSPLISTDRRVAALIIGGAPAWSRRLRRIDTLTDAAEARLRAAWLGLARGQVASAEEFGAAWRTCAAEQDFVAVNDLIGRHNRYFPIEANLRMSPRTGDYIGPGGGEWRRQPLDEAWVLERFPEDLSAALAALRREPQTYV